MAKGEVAFSTLVSAVVAGVGPKAAMSGYWRFLSPPAFPATRLWGITHF